MSAKKSYNRFFIIFQEEDKGYGIGPDRPPTGYVKVETKGDKGKVTVYVQNLKPFEDGECLYKCYLISHQDKKDDVVYLGIMNIDELGRGESSWESGADNAFDSKVPVEKFNAAAIVVESKGINNLVAPLAGYMSKEKFEWRSKMPVKQQKAEAVPDEGAVNQQISDEAEKFETYERQVEEIANKVKEAEKPEAESDAPREVNEVVEEKVETAEVVEETREAVEETTEVVEETREVAEETAEVVEETREVDEEPAEAVEETRELVEETAEAVKETAEKVEEKVETLREETGTVEAGKVEDELDRKHKQKNKHYPCGQQGYTGYSQYDFRKMLKKFLEDILDDCDEVDLSKLLKGCRMWKIDMGKYSKDRHKIFKFPCYDLVFYLLMNNPYCNYYNYIKKHGHYLFGIEYEKDEDRQARRAVRRLIFGIPGTNSIVDQPFQGVTGFTAWAPSRANSNEGYWLMAYDPMTGLVTSLDD